MRPTETMPHGLQLISRVGGFRLRWHDGRTAGRVAVKLRRDRTAWLAFCDAWDGCSWKRDKVISCPAIDQLERDVRQYAAAVDEHGYVASGQCHAAPA